MRRASWALAAFLLPAVASIALAIPVSVKRATLIDAIALVDYSKPPRFKVGDYVRYHVTNTAVGVDVKDYTLTLLIAGEEEFWGEKCFWLETWTDESGGGHQAAASLMSYDIFSDSLAEDRVQLYRRKVISGQDEDGHIQEDLTRGNANLSVTRNAPGRAGNYISDTLAVDSIQTPIGTLQSRHVHVFSGKRLTQNEGDSTLVTERRQERDRWLSDVVPITHMSFEKTETTSRRRSWRIGYSGDAAPERILDDGLLVGRVIETGHGLKPRLLPLDRATSFAQQAAKRAGGTRTAARR
jgi:hypothetical protein